MRVGNIHERTLDAPPKKVAPLIDGLASANDHLWPVDRWPAMQLDLPLAVGATGGHGPIRYSVESYTPGHSIQFRFTEPKGFVGVHRFEIEPTADGKATLRHVIEMQAAGLAWLAWAIAIRPLHDALLEDALDRAEFFVGKQLPKREWSAWVKLVRGIMRRRRNRNA
ncbi:MAG: SRPBCC family protein [Planctomycetaceae bacterium]|jgi:hypothetical protein|nr:SRPBCC family protein [Planctomycetaceae bacterium]